MVSPHPVVAHAGRANGNQKEYREAAGSADLFPQNAKNPPFKYTHFEKVHEIFIYYKNTLHFCKKGVYDSTEIFSIDIKEDSYGTNLAAASG